MNLWDVTKFLNRLVLDNDGLITLETEEKNGFEYAFYLKHPDGLEKLLFTKNKRFDSKVRYKKGSYKAIFFYRFNSSVVKNEVYFYIDINGLLEIKEMNKSCVVDMEGYKIDFYNIGSSKTFIVFNATGTNKKTQPFGLEYLIRKGFNVVACLQDENQYQELSFNDMEKYVAPLIKNHEVYLYGSSLGGYCAVYYAGAVNGTVIAAAPRNSAHPLLIDYSKNQSPYLKEDFKHLNFSDNKTTNKSVYVFYDPYEKKDLLFIESLIKNVFDNLYLIRCDYAGHEVLYHLNKTDQLSEIITAITSNKKPVIQEVDSAYTYFGKAQQEALNNNYSSSLFLVEKALKDYSISENIRNRFMSFHKRIAYKVNNEALVKSFERKVFNHKGFIALETEAGDSFEYAFYLKHPKGIEKEFYKSTSTHITNIIFSEGDYTATFFYKYHGSIVSQSLSFRINKDLSVVKQR